MRIMAASCGLVAVALLAGCGGEESAGGSDGPVEKEATTETTTAEASPSLREGTAAELVAELAVDGDYCSIPLPPMPAPTVAGSEEPGGDFAQVQIQGVVDSAEGADAPLGQTSMISVSVTKDLDLELLGDAFEGSNGADAGTSPIEGYPGSQVSTESFAVPGGQQRMTSAQYLTGDDLVTVTVSSLSAEGAADPAELIRGILDGLTGRADTRPIDPCAVPGDASGGVGPSFDGSTGTVAPVAPVDPVGPSFNTGQATTSVP